MSASEGTANSPGADARANAPGGTAQQAAVRDQLRAKLRFEGLAIKALRQETTPWARQKQYLSLRDAVAAGEQDGIAAAKKRCRLAASDLRCVCAYVQKQYNDVYEAARAAFGPPVDGKDPLCTLVLEESKRYVEELLGNSDSASDHAATSAGTAAHTSVDHASADHESQPLMLLNSDSSPRAKGCTSKFQNFVRLGNCSRIDHNKLQGGGPAIYCDRILRNSKVAPYVGELGFKSARERLHEQVPKFCQTW